MRFFAFAVVFNFVVDVSFASPPEVPRKINFAGMVLTLSEAARRDIQHDVNLVCGHEKYFNVKAERAKTYFPIIKQIFEREGLPEDFKYLAIQESALIGDAVSVSNAVGFWQFKDYTAREIGLPVDEGVDERMNIAASTTGAARYLKRSNQKIYNWVYSFRSKDYTAREIGLRVDEVVDERMNIAASTTGAARYLKRSNQKLDNWVYSLQSYQMGLGGVMRSVGNRNKGVSAMDISADTYWYVKKFLATKTAFENALAGEPQFKVAIQTVQSKRLSDLISETGHNEKVIRDLNKWIIKDVIPGDKNYVVVLPVKNIDAAEPQLYAVLEAATASQYAKAAGASAQKTVRKARRSRSAQFFNGVPASYAYKNESLHDFSRRMHLSPRQVRSRNDLAKDAPWKSEAYYFLEPKKKHGEKDVTLALKGEDWWDISQRTGVRLKKLRNYNRGVNLAEGQPIRLKPKPFLAFLKKQEEEALEPVAEPAGDWNSPLKKQDKNPPVAAKTEKPTTPLPIDSSKPEKKTPPKAPVNQEAAAEASEAKIVEHIVQQGETLYAIARKYNVKADSLSRWNKLTGGPIHQGDKLVVQRGEKKSFETESADTTSNRSAKSDFLIHEVAPKETLFSIARKYSVSVKELMDWNNKTDFSVGIGEKIKINRR